MNYTQWHPGAIERQAEPDPSVGAGMPFGRADGPEGAQPGSSEPAPSPGGRRARTFTLRSYLTVMALAVMVPMGILGSVAIHQAAREYQIAYQERLRGTARLLGIALDGDILMRKTAIMALTTSPLLDDPTTQQTYDYVKQIGLELGAWVSVDDAAGAVLNTRFAYGEPLPPRRSAWDPAHAAQYRVTDLAPSFNSAQPMVNVVGPVIRNGKVLATVAMRLPPEQLQHRLTQGLLTEKGVICLVDSNGLVVARTRNAAQYIGHRVPDWLLAAAAAPDQVIAQGRLLDGGDVIVATGHPSEAPQWTVFVTQPIAGYYQEWFRPMMVLGGGGLALLLALLLLVDRFALWLVRPLKALTQNAKIVARGRRERLPEAPHISRVAEFETLRVSLNDAAHVMEGRAEAIRVAFASARRERNLLHSVVNGTADPTYVRDLDGRLVLGNAAGLVLHGLQTSRYLGQAIYRPGLNVTEAQCRAEDAQVIATGLPVMIDRVYEVDGERRSFVGTKSPWRSASGAVLGVVSIIHDITEWKRSENRLRDIQAELIRTGRLSAMGAMANGLAHELNQPLSAITNYLGAARRLIAQCPPDPPPVAEQITPLAASLLPLGVARGAIEDACAQAMRAGEIVSRLRDFIGRGVATMRIETIADVIADACALALPQDTRGRVSLRVSVAPELEPVFADRIQIQQVLVNLVLNAVQSMDGAPKQAITITAARDDNGDTCIRVADTGPGIPDAMMSTMFDPFVTSRTGGLGMGLAIARMIVAAHGGTLSASNNKGGNNDDANGENGGATLTLVLPAVLSMEDADA